MLYMSLNLPRSMLNICSRRKKVWQEGQHQAQYVRLRPSRRLAFKFGKYII